MLLLLYIYIYISGALVAARIGHKHRFYDLDGRWLCGRVRALNPHCITRIPLTCVLLALARAFPSPARTPCDIYSMPRPRNIFEYIFLFLFQSIERFSQFYSNYLLRIHPSLEKKLLNYSRRESGRTKKGIKFFSLFPIPRNEWVCLFS